jgi:hypothetical protein
LSPSLPAAPAEPGGPWRGRDRCRKPDRKPKTTPILDEQPTTFPPGFGSQSLTDPVSASVRQRYSHLFPQLNQETVCGRKEWGG